MERCVPTLRQNGDTGHEHPTITTPKTVSNTRLFTMKLRIQKPLLIAICATALSIGSLGKESLPTAAVPTPSPTPAPPSISRYDSELLRLTNAERQRAGLPPLRFSAQLGRAAQSHAADMVARRFFSHTGSNGSSTVERATAVGYRYSFLGENIAAGAATPEDTIRQWMQSPGHRRNILDANFTEIGFGYMSASADRYRYYWVQVFGTPRN